MPFMDQEQTVAFNLPGAFTIVDPHFGIKNILEELNNEPKNVENMAAFYKVLWELCTDPVAQMSVLEDWKHMVDLHCENAFTMTWVSPTRKRATRLRSSTRTRAGELDDLATIKFGLDKWKGIAVLGHYSQGSRMVTGDEPEECNHCKAGNGPFKDCIRNSRCSTLATARSACAGTEHAPTASSQTVPMGSQGDGTLDLLANTGEGINEQGVNGGIKGFFMPGDYEEVNGYTMNYVYTG
ncbi:hypothetical protein EG327_005656 [Venturia inaequalis]|uniref:Uncharacterized protein n=1 Tax=Venturia inaequalis TaxID=5025 RepID=A0A8H3U176_VENIN|nr:hypothetical protein EG327_005656 [Venturia inaequalis]